MECYVATETEVLVMKMLLMDGDREVIRQDIRETMGGRFVWFEDEIGTLHDPMHGPVKRLGPNGYINPEDN